MANKFTKHIPNTITCMNLFSGCICCVMAIWHFYDYALLCIILSAIFDFFDGLAARTLNAHSIIGKDIDSLADDISFGYVLFLVRFTHWRRGMVGVRAFRSFPDCRFLSPPFG